MECSIRPAGSADQAFITEMQYAAIFVPEGAAPASWSVLDAPGVRAYHVDFGRRSGDIGYVAVDGGGHPVGAVWARRHEADEPGYGWVDADTPELSIAVVADARCRGVGGELMAAIVHATPRLSLSVDDRNPAMRLYERHGFRLVQRDGHSVVMLRDGSSA